MTTREFSSFFLFTGHIPPDQLVISSFGIKRPQFFYCKPLRWGSLSLAFYKSPLKRFYTIDYLSLKTGSKEYYKWDLGSVRPRDCSVLELCRNICILQQPFHCCAGLSHPDECFWFFGKRWLTYDCLRSRDLTDDSLILEASQHCKATLDLRTKCSIFKIRKEQFICWYVENEFWDQKHG